MKVLSRFTIFTLICTILTGCIFSGCTLKENINNTITERIDEYFLTITSGEYIQSSSQNDASTRSTFDTLSFIDDDMGICLDASLKKLNYSIIDITVDEDKHSAICKITFSFIDIDEIIEGLDFGSINVETICTQINSTNALQQDARVELLLEYDQLFP